VGVTTIGGDKYKTVEKLFINMSLCLSWGSKKRKWNKNFYGRGDKASSGQTFFKCN